MKYKKCIGCDKPCEDALCPKCEYKILILAKALKDNGLWLELKEVSVKGDK